jgi:hypothetical protein
MPENPTPPHEESEPSESELIDGKRHEFALALRACTTKERGLLRALPEYGYQLWRAGLKLGYSRRAIHLMVRRPRFQHARLAISALIEAEQLVDTQAVISEYSRLAHSNIKDFYDPNGNLISPDKWTEDMGAVVAERSFDERGNPKIKLHDKKGALDALAKFLRLMPDRLEVTGANGKDLNPPTPVLNVIIAGKPDPTPESK